MLSHVCKNFFLLTTAQKLQNSIKIFLRYEHKRTATFFESQCIRTLPTVNPRTRNRANFSDPLDTAQVGFFQRRSS